MAGPKIANRVRETATTTGTGAFALLGAVTGYVSFSAGIGVSNSCWYVIQAQSLAEWEVGIGTLSAATTLTRDTVLASSNAGALVNFSAGTKDVFVTLAATQCVLASRYIEVGDNGELRMVRYAGSTTPNARGSNAIDLQIQRSAANEVAAGLQSFIGAGRNNKIDSGGEACSIVGGVGNQSASSLRTFIGGGTGNIVSGSGTDAAICGGDTNQASGEQSFIGAGISNLTSGTNSAIAGGNNNEASGIGSAIPGGTNNTASGDNSFAHGSEAKASLYGQYSRANGKFAAQGDCQSGNVILRGTTTNATATDLALDGSSAQFIVSRDKSVMFCSGTVAGRDDDTDVGGWTFLAFVRRDTGAASIAFITPATVTLVNKTVGALAWDVEVVVDTGDGSIRVRVTGAASETIRWMAAMDFVELGGP